MDTRIKEEATDHKAIDVEGIKNSVNAQLRVRVQKVEAYYLFRQKRHLKRGDVSQNASAVYQDTLRVISDAYFSEYSPEFHSSVTMLLDYRAIPAIKNEIAGLFQVDDAALRKMFILSHKERLNETHRQEIQASVILEAIRYFRYRLSSFFNERDFDFFQKPLNGPSENRVKM